MHTHDADRRQAAQLALSLVHAALGAAALLWLLTLLVAARYWHVIASDILLAVAVIDAIILLGLSAALGLLISCQICAAGACGIWRVATREHGFLWQCASLLLGSVCLAVAVLLWP